eukprot:227505-Pyramimonas_sp.AAC.1
MECRKATQDMEERHITKEELRTISKGKGKVKGKSDTQGSAPPPHKPKQRDMKYLGDYGAEEGYIFTMKRVRERGPRRPGEHGSHLRR